MDYLSPEVSLQTLALLGLLGAGVGTLVDQAWKKDWHSVTKISVCTGVLALAALLVDGLTVLEGAALGLQASGLITIASYVGKKSGGPSVAVAASDSTPNTVPVVAGELGE
jgi:predicted Na+-dependent transporter